MLEISSFHGVFGVFDLELGHELVLRGSVLGSPNALSEPLSDGGHVRPLLSDKFAVEQHSLIGHLKGTDAGDELVAGERVVVTLDQLAVTVVHSPHFRHLVGQRIYFRAQGLVNRSRNYKALFSENLLLAAKSAYLAGSWRVWVEWLLQLTQCSITIVCSSDSLSPETVCLRVRPRADLGGSCCL